MPTDSTAPTARPLRRALETLADILHADAPPADDALDRLLERLLPDVPGARWASVTWRAAPEAGFSTPAATGLPARAADELQYATGDGPCLAACRGGAVQASELDLEHRWPDFAAALRRATPIRGALSVPLPGRSGDASLNFYTDSPDGLAGEPVLAGAAEVAAVCSVALAAVAARRRADNLHTALATSRQIAAAVGIVMAHERSSYEEAFQVLRAVSQKSHRKLRDVAEDVLFTGALPGQPAS